MIRKAILLFLVVTTMQTVFAQQDGFWDKNRATTKEILLGAGDRIVVKTEDFPKGTTEVVYRITTLDDNQQLAGSLVSLLKSIPDPSGISQGSAGAVFIVSKISGDDKCKYAIFSTNELASAYKESGKADKACFAQNTPLNKDAKLLSFEKSACLKTNTTNMFFAFESDNWLMKQKIVLEVVPWVDYKLSKGWSPENRKSIIDLCKTSNLAELMINPDDFCVCILDKMQMKYKFQEYQKLLASEKSKAFKDFGTECLSKNPANDAIHNGIRLDAFQHFKNKRYDEAIRLLHAGIIDNGNAKVLDYDALGTYYLYSKQFGKAIKYLKEGELLDDSELQIQLNLAHAYLLSGNYTEAKNLHKKYQNQNVSALMDWKTKTIQDFEDLKKTGFQSKDFDRILKLFND